MISKHLFCVLAFFINLNCIRASETYKSVIWDPENPLFIDGKTNCTHKYKRLKIRSASKIKFICPNVATVLQTTAKEVSKTNKYENLWLLYDKTSFEKCDTTLDINVTQPVLRCTEPTQLEFHSITFQRFAALPDEQVFTKGQSYYIIATSNGQYSHINDTNGGHCNDTANKVSMKIEVYVCNDTDQVEDEMCKEGVGELTCPDSDVTSSSTSMSTPTPTRIPTLSSPHVTISSTPSKATGAQTTWSPATTVTKTYTVTVETSAAATEKPPSEGDTQGRKGDPNEDSERAWMITAMVFMVICFVIVVTLIVYHFWCGKKTTCQYETRRKIDPSPQYGRKNLAFKPDVGGNEHNSSVTEQEIGSPPDKDTTLVIYNKEVFYNNKENEGENGKENPPV